MIKTVLPLLSGEVCVTFEEAIAAARAQVFSWDVLSSCICVFFALVTSFFCFVALPVFWVSFSPVATFSRNLNEVNT